MRKKCLVLALSVFPVRNFRPFKERIAIGGILRELSNVMRKPTFCICENKGADQLRSNCEADQRLCFCYMDSTVPLVSKSEISSL